MSPEQAFGDGPIDHRSDLYSVAVCLYEMLVGERLYVADLISSPRAIYAQPVPKLESQPEMPRGIDAVFGKILALDPDDRYQTALEFQEALLQVAYDNNLILGSSDLGAELRTKCGESAAAWRREHDPENVPPPTELVSSSTQFSGVELTSVLQASDLLEQIESSAELGISSAPALLDEAIETLSTSHEIVDDLLAGDAQAARHEPISHSAASDAPVAPVPADEEETLTFIPPDPMPPASPPASPAPEGPTLTDNALIERMEAESAKLEREAGETVRCEAYSNDEALRERAMLIASGVLLISAAILLVLASLIG
jgi:serine/threonine protein kinase